MKRDAIDFHVIPEKQQAIHARLENWASWVKPRQSWPVHPMFRQCRSNAWQWHPPEHRPTCDTQDAVKLENIIGTMPEPFRTALRWWYVFPIPPWHARKYFATTTEGLDRLVKDARTMLANLDQ